MSENKDLLRLSFSEAIKNLNKFVNNMKNERLKRNEREYQELEDVYE